MIDYRTYHMTASENRTYFILAVSFLFSLGYLFYKNIVISAVFSLCALPLKRFAEEHLAQKRREELSAQFRDLLYSMSSSVSAGRQLPEALEEAAGQLAAGYGEKAVLYLEAAAMVRGMKESKEDPDTLLIDFARRSQIAEIRQFVQICSICRRTGGDMEQVMGKTAAVLMEKIAVQREIQMVTAQKRLEANILTAMPIGMVLMLNLLSPDYLAVLYNSFQGRIIMTAALLVMGFAMYLSRKITEIPV